MVVELQVLGWAVLLAAAQLVSFAIPANLQLGADYTAGPRDEKRELSGIAARLQRAYLNHIEGLVLFGAAAVVVSYGYASTPQTEAAALTYLAARVAYVPAYVSGIPYLRSAIWAVGFGATLSMVVAALSN
ncbi:MAG: MAPEG family protein [Pseudomonadota bacterium]